MISAHAATTGMSTQNGIRPVLSGAQHYRTARELAVPGDEAHPDDVDRQPRGGETSFRPSLGRSASKAMQTPMIT